MMMVKGSAVLLSLLMVIGSGVNASESGRFLVLTYNVAGVPPFLKPSNIEANTTRMGPLMNRFDLVLLQEDFVYHWQLATEVDHSYRSIPKKILRFVNDGLNRFSRFPFGALHRESWKRCHGIDGHHHDCLADKGFSMAAHRLADGVVIHVYNLHMDAGRVKRDFLARKAQLRQLLTAIQVRSRGMAVIVAGDTNLHMTSRVDDRGLLDALLKSAGLTDACRQVDCGDERYDRILFRSGGGVELCVDRWEIDDRFVDERGKNLSDHLPVVVEFSWLQNGRGH